MVFRKIMTVGIIGLFSSNLIFSADQDRMAEQEAPDLLAIEAEKKSRTEFELELELLVNKWGQQTHESLMNNAVRPWLEEVSKSTLAALAAQEAAAKKKDEETARKKQERTKFWADFGNQWAKNLKENQHKQALAKSSSSTTSAASSSSSASTSSSSASSSSSK